MDENKKLTLIIDMMKIRKILLSGCLVVTLCSCGGSQNENLNLTLSKDALFDKVKGAWAGQVIGCTYGGPTEFRYLSTMIPDSIVMPWGPGEIKNGLMVVAVCTMMCMWI